MHSKRKMSAKVAVVNSDNAQNNSDSSDASHRTTQASLSYNFRRTSKLFLGNLENGTSDVQWVAGTPTPLRSPTRMRHSAFALTSVDDGKDATTTAAALPPKPVAAHNHKAPNAREMLAETEEGSGKEHHYHVRESGGKIQIVYDEEEVHRFIVPWNNKYRRTWDLLIVVLVLYLCFKIPFALAFDDYEFNYTFDTIMDICFYMDIILNFRTGFVHNGEHVTDPKEIAKHYLHTYLIFDVVASIPFGNLINKNHRKSLKMIKWMKIPKLLRVNRIIKQLKRYAKYYQVVLLVAGMVLTIHLTGCFWMSVASPCAAEFDKPCSSDLILLYYFVSLYLSVLSIFAVTDVFQFVSLVDRGLSLYAVNSTAAGSVVKLASGVMGLSSLNNETCGYPSPAISRGVFVDSTNVSLFYPETDYSDVAWSKWNVFNENEKLTVIGLYSVSIFATFAGSVMMILLIGQSVVFAISSASRYHDFYSKVDLVKSEMSDARIPEDIQYRVSRFYDYLWMNKKQGLGSNTSGMLHDPDLSRPLRKELALHLHGPLLTSLKIFNGVSSDCLFAVAMKLKSHIYMPDDIIFQKGDVAHELFFIRRGTIKVLFGEVDPSLQLQSKDEKLAKKIHDDNLQNESVDAHDINSMKKYSTAEGELAMGEEGGLFKLMGPGSYFGEIALLTELPRVCTVQSYTMSELNELAKEDFEEAMLQFPELNDEVLDHAVKTYPGLEMHLRKLSVRISRKRAERHELHQTKPHVPVVDRNSIQSSHSLNSVPGVRNSVMLSPLGSGSAVATQKDMSARLERIETVLMKLASPNSSV